MTSNVSKMPQTILEKHTPKLTYKNKLIKAHIVASTLTNRVSRLSVMSFECYFQKDDNDDKRRE